MTTYLCLNCNTDRMTPFYEMAPAPVHSVLLLDTQAEAMTYPTGKIKLGFCTTCGFIANVTFDATLQAYSSRYEATQGFSQTFNAFHKRLAQHLIDRYDLHQKKIIEIGCDKGEFLTLLCEMGDNEGVGFDPAYVSGRNKSTTNNHNLTFIKDFYSEKYAHYQGDFFCCKMTLEHISDTAAFVRTVRQAIGNQPHTTVFFQVPNASYVFQDVAFWDIYYEHCSYFSAGSLAYLFQHVGFDVLNLWTDYDDQYLMIEARPSAPQKVKADITSISTAVTHFQQAVPEQLAKWQAALATMRTNDRRVVLWGGGSKGVAFLTTLGITTDTIAYVVDINPHKAGTFMAGTGQEIVLPDFLRTYQPDVIIIMNPIYRQEISNDLRQMALAPKILTV